MIEMSGCKPALLVVNSGDYRNREERPSEDEVREAVVSALDEKWGNPADTIVDIREAMVAIQHEVPPADPYSGFAIVITFAQTEMQDYNQFRDGPWSRSNLESPILDAMEALHREFSEGIEVWLDGSEAGGFLQ